MVLWASVVVEAFHSKQGFEVLKNSLRDGEIRDYEMIRMPAILERDYRHPVWSD